MPKLKHKGRWLREFGQGLTDDPQKAHDFTDDEAYALKKLYGYTSDDTLEPRELHDGPSFAPGDDMVWVRYNNCWYAAERQALFVGTQKALTAHGIDQALLA